MTDETMSNQTEDQDDQAPQVDELALLKQRANFMNIPYSNNIGVDALKAKIAAHLAGEPADDEKTDDLDPAETLDTVEQPNALNGLSKPMTLRQRLLEENMKLVRLRITNLDPKKKDLPGEIYTVANEYIGTVRKFIPFGEHTENGFHVPYILYQFMKDKRFLNIRTVRDRVTRQIKVTQSWAPEFSLEIMDPLTPAELEDLKRAQIAAGSVDAPDNNLA